MFNKWLTQQEKDDFISQLEADGWKFQENPQTYTRAGTTYDMLKVQKHPKDLDELNKVAWVKVIYSAVDYTVKLEPYNTPKEKKIKIKEFRAKNKKK